MVSLIDVFDSSATVQHTCVLAALKNSCGDSSKTRHLVFEGEDLPLRVLCDNGADFRRSINRGAKREQEQSYFGFILLFDGLDKVFLVDPSNFPKSKLDRKPLENWLRTQKPWFQINVNKEKGEVCAELL